MWLVRYQGSFFSPLPSISRRRSKNLRSYCLQTHVIWANVYVPWKLELHEFWCIFNRSVPSEGPHNLGEEENETQAQLHLNHKIWFLCFLTLCYFPVTINSWKNIDRWTKLSIKWNRFIFECLPADVWKFSSTIVEIWL